MDIGSHGAGRQELAMAAAIANNIACSSTRGLWLTYVVGLQAQMILVAAYPRRRLARELSTIVDGKGRLATISGS